MPDPALQPGPCIICAGVNYPLSVGGWNICPHCDIGAPKETSPYRPNLTSDGSVEYDCADCGRHVVAFGFNTQIERCNTCHWIVTMWPHSSGSGFRPMPDPALTIYFRPCRVCNTLIGSMEDDLTPICQDCAAKQDKSPPERADA